MPKELATRMREPEQTSVREPAPTTRRRPRWQQIQLQLEQEIRSGVFGPGERLPTEEEFAERFAVHRHTVRRAIERLRHKDIVRVEQGSGTFVREAAVTYRLGPRSRLTA